MAKKVVERKRQSSNEVASNSDDARAPTGIALFDKLTEGGFLRKSVNLITGGAGTGKTTFVLQFLWNGITKYNENGLFVSFEDDLDNTRRDSRGYGWDFSEYEKKRMITFRSVIPFEQGFSIEKQKNMIMREFLSFVRKNDVKRIVIDPITLFGMAFKSSYDIRRNLFELVYMLKRLGCTVLITSEIAGEAPLDISAGGNFSRFGVEEFIADSVVVLHSSGLGGESDRALRIIKMRRTNHHRSPIPMALGKNGVELFEE